MVVKDKVRFALLFLFPMHHTRQLIFILIVATCFRFYNLNGQSLWSDEGNSVAMTAYTFSEIVQRTAYDIHPPLYYWLLKMWVMVFGTTEIALRSLSAFLGVVLVYLTYLLGQHLFTRRVGIIAAFISACLPLQIYYAQEVRMYMLLAVLSTLTVLLAYWLSNRFWGTIRYWLIGIAYILTVTAGLYTHYAYPLVLVVVNSFAIVSWLHKKIENSKLQATPGHLQITIHKFLFLQLISLLLYVPWLPTAYRQLTTWPSEKQVIPLNAILQTLADTLLLGLSWPYETGWLTTIIITLAIIIAIIPLKSVKHTLSPYVLLLLWLLLPILLTIFIYSPAFLKFLIVATPPLALLLALAFNKIAISMQNNQSQIYINDRKNRHQKSFLPIFFSRFFYPLSLFSIPYPLLLTSFLLSMLTQMFFLSFYHYHTNPTFARDNYRGIVNFIEAIHQPQTAIILNAEGQQDIFNYYYQALTPKGSEKLPIHPLPRSRPFDETETIAELTEITSQVSQIYAVYWASQQADPTGVIEGWLDNNLYKATDQWYGNVRLVSYATQAELQFTPYPLRFENKIKLTHYGLGSNQLIPGNILQLGLVWQTTEAISKNYTIFMQILDRANHLVGQRDAPPQLPSSAWGVNQALTDTHGIFIEPGTPPGQYRLIVGLYDSQTGQRLSLDDGSADFVELTTITINRPNVPLPPAAFQIQHTLNETLNGLTWLGYDLYKVGHRSTPETPLHPNDPIRLVAYWQKTGASTDLDNSIEVTIVNTNGLATPITITAPLAGIDYPLEAWQTDQIIRAQYDLFLSGLEPGLYRVQFIWSSGEVVQTGLFRVEF